MKTSRNLECCCHGLSRKTLKVQGSEGTKNVDTESEIGENRAPAGKKNEKMWVPYESDSQAFDGLLGNEPRLDPCTCRPCPGSQQFQCHWATFSKGTIAASNTH